jgi:hypothetical protein
MAVYCEPLPDEEIIAQLGDARSVLIIGCPACPSIRCALDGSSPIAAVTMTGVQAVGTKSETDRLIQLLTGKGLDVESWILKIPELLCEIDRDGLRKASRKYQDMDAIIALGCEVGRDNISDSFKGAKIIGAMNAKGLISFPAIRKLNKFSADKGNVKIHTFQLLQE